jgi:hypothetical protein
MFSILDPKKCIYRYTPPIKMKKNEKRERKKIYITQTEMDQKRIRKNEKELFTHNYLKVFIRKA